MFKYLWKQQMSCTITKVLPLDSGQAPAGQILILADPQTVLSFAVS